MNRLPFIDGLRGLAILMVLLVHTSQFCGNNSLTSFHYVFLENLVNSGARGVQLFFIISAFTLFYTSKQHFPQDHNPYASFYLRRFFRIMPLWWLAITLYGYNRMKEAVPYYLMYFGFINFALKTVIFSPGWTIFVEETFYIFLPFLFKKITSFSRSILFFFACFFIGKTWIHYGDILPKGNSFVFEFPISQWMFFAFGICLFFKKEANIKVFWFDICAIISFLIVFGMSLEYFYSLIPLGMIFYSAQYGGHFWGNITQLNFVRLFGKYCYSIYLFHLFVLNKADFVREHLMAYLGITTVELQTAIWLPIISITMLGLSHISYKIFEKPSIYLGKRLINKLNGKKVIKLPNYFF